MAEKIKDFKLKLPHVVSISASMFASNYFLALNPEFTRKHIVNDLGRELGQIISDGIDTAKLPMWRHEETNLDGKKFSVEMFLVTDPKALADDINEQVSEYNDDVNQKAYKVLLEHFSNEDVADIFGCLDRARIVFRELA